MKYRYLLFISLILLFGQCKKKETLNSIPFDATFQELNFGNLKSIRTSEVLADIRFVKLETINSSIIGDINQIEIHNDIIYILDRHTNFCVYRYSMDGKYLDKLDKRGGGPGEFIAPHSFYIDNNEFILILDASLSKLFKYDLNNFEFVEEIIIPRAGALSFQKTPNKDQYIYYYPTLKHEPNKKQIIISDAKGHIIRELYNGVFSGSILHGSAQNIYSYKNQTLFYPYFSNNVYSISQEKGINLKYSFHWGKTTFPPESFFNEYQNRHSRELMAEVIQGNHDWIRLMYIYETTNSILVKYYIHHNLYLSGYSKKDNRTFNFKASDFEDDLGLGNVFPLPLGLYEEEYIGEINVDELDKSKIKNKDLLILAKNWKREDNPILCFYTIR